MKKFKLVALVAILAWIGLAIGIIFVVSEYRQFETTNSILPMSDAPNTEFYVLPSFAIVFYGLTILMNIVVLFAKPGDIARKSTKGIIICNAISVSLCLATVIYLAVSQAAFLDSLIANGFNAPQYGGQARWIVPDNPPGLISGLLCFLASLVSLGITCIANFGLKTTMSTLATVAPSAIDASTSMAGLNDDTVTVEVEVVTKK